MSCEDDPHDTLRPRLDKLGADVEGVHFLEGLRTADGKTKFFSLRDHVEYLANSLEQLPNVRLLVLDPISAYMGEKTDTNSNSHVRGVLGPICELAAQFRVAVIGISHFSKRESKAIHRTLGSTAFVAAARATWAIVSDPEDEDRRLFLHVKSNLEQKPLGLAFRITDGGVEWEADPVLVDIEDVSGGSNAQKKAAKWLLEQLKSGQRVAVADLEVKAKEVGLGWRNVTEAKKQAGVTSTRIGKRWWWALTKATTLAEGHSEESFVI